MSEVDYNRERQEGAGRKIAAIALSPGALTAPAVTAGASDLDAMRAQFATSFTPGSSDTELVAEGSSLGLIQDR